MATGGAWCAGVQKADTVEAARMLGSPLAPFTALPDDGSTNFDTFSQLMLRGLCLDPLLQPFEMAVRTLSPPLADCARNPPLTPTHLREFAPRLCCRTP
jgi:hypothetical protein